MKKTVKFISSFQKIAIVSHERPDGDAVGSVLGFLRFLKSKGFEVYGVLKDGIPKVFDFLGGDYEIFTNLPNADVYILVDASDWSRTGFPMPDKPIIRFDHHLTGERYSEYDILDESYPSATSVILEFLRFWDEGNIDYSVALPLYVGLLTDTGSFKNRDGTKSFEDAIYLINKGVNPKWVAERVFRETPFETYKLLSLALKTLNVVDGKIGYMIIREEFFKETGTSKEHTEEFVEYPLSIRGVMVAFKMEWDPRGYWKVGLRSKEGGPNVAKIAQRFGGGGHHFSAGCKVYGSEQEVLDAIISEIKRHL
ncbi:MAG: bifunctional oligoribonuclease/PAP phosphatase NrnA [candidate division WOR-3 bacterium]